MRKIVTLTLLTALAVTLAACGAAAASNSTNAAGGQTAASAPNAVGTLGPNNAPVPRLTRLLIGTFNLEETELAVTPDQAKALLPLWQAIRSLSASDTAASAEMAALEQQIQDTLTTEQQAQIATMPITRAEMQTLAEKLGITFNTGNRANASGTPVARGNGGFPPGGGGFPGGGPGPGGFQNLSPEQQTTLEARRASRPNLGVPAPFVEALIQLLEAKAK